MSIKMELYIHIPFCVKKCNYCDFLSFPGYGCDADERHRSLSCDYVDALLREIEEIKNRFICQKFETCFIGGGTPSVLDVREAEKLLACIRNCVFPETGKNEDHIYNISNKIEFTIECNPGTLTREKLLLYKKYGVNRLSLGQQSADNNILKKLGRIHTYGEFLESYKLARECGFNNINVDLISAVPGQTLDNWKDTLEKVVALSPEHISAYSLILEEGTPLFSDYEKNPGSLNLPDEDAEREIYHITEKILNENGYHRYEISNYAKPGFECRHNIGYWTGEEYIGTGLGSASYLSSENCRSLLNKSFAAPNMIRIKNTEDLHIYISRVSDKGKDSAGGENSGINQEVRSIEEVLDTASQMSEYCILGLRMCRGISRSEFTKRFGRDIYEVFGDIIRKHMDDKLLEEREGYIKCTQKGLDLNNTVLCDFLDV